MTLGNISLAIGLIGALLIAGKTIRAAVKPLQDLFIPSSIIAGILALLLGHQVLGNVSSYCPVLCDFLPRGLWPGHTLRVWSSLPGLLISVVFAGLFLGKDIPGPRTIWRHAGPMVTHGQILAWGQYVVGLSIVLLMLNFGYDFSPLAGALIEIGFEGGHGTAAGLAGTFGELGFPSGADLALALATIGVVLGVLLGTVFVNWGIRKGHIDPPDGSHHRVSPKDSATDELLDDTDDALSYSDRTIEPLSIHIGLISLAIFLGWGILRALVGIETLLLIPLGWPELMRHVPLFPMAMIGGVLVQKAASKLKLQGKIDRKIITRISGTALDFLIVAALATISLAAIGDNMHLLLALAVGGIVWNIFGLLVLARFLFGKEWLTYGLANFGQGTGMTVVGLMLVKMCDPMMKTRALEAFGYKQLLFEPIVGGGIFTAASLPLIYEFGPVPVLVGVFALMLGWLFFGWRSFRVKKRSSRIR